jgi:proteasome lid subunit RPN8/RPN11
MLEIDRGFFDEMVEHGLASFPNEACGLLAGKEGRPVRFFPMTNADSSSGTYRFDPVENLRVVNEMEDLGWDQLAIFHTHTHSEAFPSATDTEKALWANTTQASFPDSFYLILSLSDRENPILRAFKIADGGVVTEQELTIG